MATRGHLFIISGPSGAGKSTILSAILRKRPQLRYSISYTTRPPRRDEQDGVHYHFITEAAFRNKIKGGELAEWAEVHGNLYGTSARYIEETLNDGQNVLLDIDVQGANRLIASYPEAISVFITTPNVKELEKRLMKRGMDSLSAVKKRLKNAEAEMAQAHLYNHVVINDDLSQAVLQIETIIDKAYSHG